MDDESGKVALHDLDVDAYLAQCVRLDHLNLQDEFVRIAADFAYWNEKYARCTRVYLLAKAAHGRAVAQTRLTVREILESGGRKTTESQVEARVETDEELAGSHARVIGYEAECLRLRGLLEAIRTKSQMLMQMGAHVRTEMQGSPRIREESAHARRRMEERADRPAALPNSDDDLAT